MKLLVILILVLLLASALPFAINALRAQSEEKPSLFIVINRPGETWDANKSIFEQPIQEHLDYLKELLDSGVMVMGGPFMDNQGGMILLECESAAKAEEIVDADPAIKSKLMQATVHPFVVGMIRDGIDLHPPKK